MPPTKKNAPTNHSWGRFLLFLLFAFFIIAQGPKRLGPYRFGDTPLTKDSLASEEGALKGYVGNGGKWKIAGNVIDVQSVTALYENNQLTALLARLAVTLSDPTGFERTKKLARNLTNHYGSPLKKPTDAQLKLGYSYEWKTRRCRIVLGKSSDGAYSLLLKKETK